MPGSRGKSDDSDSDLHLATPSPEDGSADGVPTAVQRRGLPELPGERTVVDRMDMAATLPSDEFRAMSELPGEATQISPPPRPTLLPEQPARAMTDPPEEGDGEELAPPVPQPTFRPVAEVAKGLELVVEVGPDRGARFPLTAAGARIGRARDNEVVLKDLTVSRHHLVLRLEDGEHLVVVDQDSGNGTFKNGDELAAPSVLRLGDRLELGRSVLRVGQASATSRSTPPRKSLLGERITSPMPARMVPPADLVRPLPAPTPPPSTGPLPKSLSTPSVTGIPATTIGDHVPTPGSLGQQDPRLASWPLPLIGPPQPRPQRRAWLPFVLVVAAGALVGAAITLAILLARG